jgi:hypothetical protein
MLSSNSIFQNAWVVDDLDQTIDYWTNTMGVGPFYLMEYQGGPEFEYRGQPGAEFGSPFQPAHACAVGGSAQAEVQWSAYY